jgi:hypothetical protein
MEAGGFEDLFDAVDTMARLLGGSVIVKDVDFRVGDSESAFGRPLVAVDGGVGDPRAADQQ